MIQPSQISGEAKIEQNDAPVGGHQDIRRLDVAMQFAGGMQGRDPFGELTHRARNFPNRAAPNAAPGARAVPSADRTYVTKSTPDTSSIVKK